MTRVLVGLVTVLGLMVGAFALTRADAQDNTEPRLSALETQVADLTTRVDALEASPPATEGGTHTLTGSIILIDNAPLQQAVGDLCPGFEEFDDVNSGAKVVVSDQAGTIIGAGELSWGEVVDYFDEDAERANDCKFTFEIDDIADVAFYTIQIAERTPLTYSHDELEGLGWTITATERGRFS